jgi:hypothetical protein
MSWITFKEQASAPDTPAGGFATMYVDSSGDFAFKLDDGSVRTISATYSENNGSTNHATTSSTYAAINDMSVSLAAGTYCLWFSATGTQTGSGVTATFAVFINGTEDTNSTRSFHNVSSHTHDLTQTIQTICAFTIASTQTVDIRFKTSGGTFTVGTRTMVTHKGG